MTGSRKTHLKNVEARPLQHFGALCAPEPGRAALLRRPNIRAEQQLGPTKFRVRVAPCESKIVPAPKFPLLSPRQRKQNDQKLFTKSFRVASAAGCRQPHLRYRLPLSPARRSGLNQ